MLKIISSKSRLLKSWHIRRTHLIWKKIDHLHQQSANLTSSGTISRITIDQDLGYKNWISDFTIEHEIRKWISLLVLMINFISQNLKISPTPTPLGANHTNKQVCYNVHCTVIKTLKKTNLQINPSYTVGNAPICL